ncbi:hypothetical protein [Streptomyces sp. MMS20-AI2-20]|uniref:hypothetical protein n=1 Tax=Streptomyces sp. MMS20-AI2-20 TaxID=2925835 RepID=UPI001F617594|nr:hypothetical protein [Streptomyces sp. MMS20-AI2-20]MCI4141897.1 hypothetical protein [Streptomyces sp. MMS20-AI2-20]
MPSSAARICSAAEWSMAWRRCWWSMFAWSRRNRRVHVTWSPAGAPSGPTTVTASSSSRSARALSATAKRRVTGRAACCNSPISSAGTSRMPLATNRAGSSTCQVRSTSAVNSKASLSLGSVSVSVNGWTPMSTSYTAV